MNRAEAPMLDDAAAGWPQRNQRWLAERFAWWREQLARDDAGAATRPPASADDTFEPAALRLAAVFGLSAFETELLVLSAGVELDEPLRDAIARAQSTPAGQPVQLGFQLALGLIEGAHWDALAPLGPLRHWSLVQVDTAAGLGQAGLRIDERILCGLTGTAAFDERLQGIAALYGFDGFDEIDEARVDDALAEPVVRRVAEALAGAQRPLAMLPNAVNDAACKRAGRALAVAAFRAIGLRTLWVDAASLGSDAREHAAIARRLDREAALAGAGVAVVVDGEGATSGAVTRLAAALRSPLIVLGSLSTMQLADLSQRSLLRFHLPEPKAVLPRGLPAAVQKAAAPALQQFHVDPALLEQSLRAVGLQGEDAMAATIWSTLRESARGGLAGLAQRIDGTASFADLVVPPSVAAQLREIASQLQQRARVHDEWGFGARSRRGLGIAALFAGESGTGKTLAAEAIANEARLDLYRIDLARTVSKYIGETEKNLGTLFDAAERSGAVLLFDEADALFGKRSEVKDSHDRYANLEVAYLLQRIESYRGLAILTTNMKSALDTAFLRRIRFVVQFPFPDAAARVRLWQRELPAAAPTAGLDPQQLGRLGVAGGSIRNIAINAAFIAAGRGSAIDPSCIAAAAQAEFLKLERPVGEVMAGWLR